MNEKTERKKGRRGFIIVVIVLVLVLLAAAALFALKQSGALDKVADAGADTAATEAEEVQFAVNTTTAVSGPIADYFEISGEVTSASSVDTYADAQGILARLHVDLGDDVRAGQIIAEVDPSRPGLNYEFSPVKARVSGTITVLPLDQGDAVNPSVPVATIGDLSRLQVVTAIPERFISRISTGMKAEIALEAWPGHTIPLTVTHVDPVVDAASRTLEIKMDIPPGQAKAKAGMYADIRLTTDEKERVIKVPADTVLRRLGETFVYVIADGHAHKRLVVPGIILDGAVEIINGLDEGEKVVWQGQTLLEDGVAVRVVRDIQVIDR